jgi:hypothetical protein
MKHYLTIISFFMFENRVINLLCLGRFRIPDFLKTFKDQDRGGEDIR